MAVGLFGRIGWDFIIHAPEIAAMGRIAMPLPQEFHAMVDHAIRAWNAKQVRHGKTMHHARRVVQLALHASTARPGAVRASVLVQSEETSSTIEGGVLKEI